MAIAFRAIQTPVAWITGSQALTIPAGTVAGDGMLLCISNKPFDGNPTPDGSWVQVGTDVTDGTVAAGNGTGSMLLRCYFLEYDGVVTGPTITTPTNNVTVAWIISFSKSSANNWAVVGSGGGDGTADTAFSITTASALALAPNDMIYAFAGFRDDGATPITTTHTLTASGVTFGAVTRQPTTDFETTSGGDQGTHAGYRLVSTGTTTVAVTMAATLPVANTGSGFVARLREVAPPPEDLHHREHKPMFGVFDEPYGVPTAHYL